MPVETPLLKVSRPVAACSRCRAAKIKCDGKLPSCSACEKTGKATECASANDNFARGKERSYVSTLETRIQKLERRLREAQQRKSSVISMNEGEADATRQDPKDIDYTLPAERRQKAEKRKEARDIDELVSDFGYLTVNATARDYYGFTTFMSYSRLIISACSKDRLPTGVTAALPPRQTAAAMIQHYMDNLYTVLPFFEETTLFYSVDAVYRAQQDPSSPVSDMDIWSVRMILAITNAFLSEQRGDQFYLEAIGHVSAALDSAERVLKPGTITNVQALLFLVEYSTLDPHHFDSWNLVGAASRAMIDLGLHQDPAKGANVPRAKLELRRRVFQSIYMLDRASAIIHTRAFTFSDNSANVAAVSAYSSSSQKSPHKWQKQYHHSTDIMALRKIQSCWYYDMFQTGREPWNDPYPYIWQTYHTMTNWFQNISPQTSEVMRVHQELDLLYSYVYILGSSPHVHKPHAYAQTLLFEHCLAYASLLHTAMNNSTHIAPVTWEDNMRVFITGLQLVDVLTVSRDLLISGVAPEPPHLPPGSPTAPSLPSIKESPYVNVVRAITALRQFSEILGAFGKRWGYDTWRDDFAKKSDQMLTGLNTRLWELQQTSNSIDAGVGRKPSYMPHNSSIGSSITTHESFSLPNGASPASPQLPGPPPSLHYRSHSIFQQPSLTGPQLRAMRLNPSTSYTGMPENFSPPTTNSDSSSPYPGTAQQLGIYLPSPPQQATASSAHHYFGGTPPPMPHEDNPRDQFAAWGGMMPGSMGQQQQQQQQHPGMHRTNS